FCRLEILAAVAAAQYPSRSARRIPRLACYSATCDASAPERGSIVAGFPIMARRPLSSFLSGTQNTAGWLLLSVGVAIAYFLAARLGLALLTKPDGVAVFWPAAGVSAGLLIALGPGARWSVVVGAMAATIAANLMGDRNLSSALVFAVCNAAEALIIATLIERYFGTPFGLDRLSHVIGFLGAAVAGTTISGI